MDKIMKAIYHCQTVVFLKENLLITLKAGHSCLDCLQCNASFHCCSISDSSQFRKKQCTQVIFPQINPRCFLS